MTVSNGGAGVRPYDKEVIGGEATPPTSAPPNPERELAGQAAILLAAAARAAHTAGTHASLTAFYTSVARVLCDLAERP